MQLPDELRLGAEDFGWIDGNNDTVGITVFDAIERANRILASRFQAWLESAQSALGTAKAALEHYESSHYCATCGNACSHDRTASEALALLRK
jgi:hypothetical protein